MAVEDIYDAEDKLDNIYISFQLISIQHCYYDHCYSYTTRVFAYKLSLMYGLSRSMRCVATRLTIQL